MVAVKKIRIIRAASLGMCFGVRDAINMALSQPAPMTILGDLVHNETVLDQLRGQGIKIVNEVAGISTPNVMITAHGASESTLARIRKRGLNVLEATCPLVHLAHRAVAKLVQEGYHPVIIGKRGHVEVRGLTEDLKEFDVVMTEEDVGQLAERPRFGVAAQTTQPIDRVRHLTGLIEKRFPKSQVCLQDTVCQPTKHRQAAARDLAEQSDVVIVIGGAQSNNTRELVTTCLQYCPRVHHIQNARDLRSVWFKAGETVGLTAGTSTPDEVILQVEQWLQDFAEFQARLAEHLNQKGELKQ
jgi:4-hydroxy-3-methylbut-2-enyl diphosphate reductase